MPMRGEWGVGGDMGGLPPLLTSACPRATRCTLGMVLPLWSDTQVFLDGDG